MVQGDCRPYPALVAVRGDYNHLGYSPELSNQRPEPPGGDAVVVSDQDSQNAFSLDFI